MRHGFGACAGDAGSAGGDLACGAGGLGGVCGDRQPASPGALWVLPFEGAPRRGRAMACEDIRRVLSDGDGRARRGRALRAHLRTCNGCRDFERALGERPRQLAALAPPLPAAASAALLAKLLPGVKGVLGGTAGAGSAGVAATAGGGLAVKATVVAVIG